jgi:hypothetical protein
MTVVNPGGNGSLPMPPEIFSAWGAIFRQNLGCRKSQIR